MNAYDSLFFIVAPDATDVFSRSGLIQMQEERYRSLFLSGMDFLAQDTNLVAIHTKDGFSTAENQIDTRYAWYAGSDEELCEIFSKGFTRVDCPKVGVSYGKGIYLYSASIYGALSSVADEYQIKHLLLCRVTLGNVEVILPGSKQLGPSSEEFQSGVDDAETPKRYIIWGGSMRTQISPVCIISFRTPYFRDFVAISELRGSPNFDTVKDNHILFMLSKLSTPSVMELIFKRWNECTDNSDHQRVQKVVEIAGEDWGEQYSSIIEGLKLGST